MSNLETQVATGKRPVFEASTKADVKRRTGRPPRPRLEPTAEMLSLLPQDSKLIALLGGSFAIVDADLFEMLDGFSWTINSSGYAVGHARVNGKDKHIRMHRRVLQTPEGMETDHINRNKLDNRRCNLRVATKSQNQWNRGCYKNNTSGFKGVSFYKRDGNWQAQIMHLGQQRKLGRYYTPEAAHEAYCQASLELHGEFARLA